MSQREAPLHRAGRKTTGPRMVILAAFAQADIHPTAEHLSDTLRPDHPSLSLSTVYRTLEVFIRTGLCRRVSGLGPRLRVVGVGRDVGCGPGPGAAPEPARACVARRDGDGQPLCGGGDLSGLSGGSSQGGEAGEAQSGARQGLEGHG